LACARSRCGCRREPMSRVLCERFVCATKFRGRDANRRVERTRLEPTIRMIERLHVWRGDCPGYGDHNVDAAGARLENDRSRIAIDREARTLGELTELSDALGRGELAFSAVRELTRVATAETEGAWIDPARDKNLRQIEELVAGHRPGDLPDQPGDP